MKNPCCVALRDRLKKHQLNYRDTVCTIRIFIKSLLESIKNRMIRNGIAQYNYITGIVLTLARNSARI